MSILLKQANFLMFKENVLFHFFAQIVLILTIVLILVNLLASWRTLDVCIIFLWLYV